VSLWVLRREFSFCNDGPSGTCGKGENADSIASMAYEILI
jgi:hypothetical protein